MQSLRMGLGPALCLSRRQASHSRTTALSCMHRESRRHATFGSPLTWIRDRLNPSMREQASEEEIEAARRKQAEEGELGVFETVPVIGDKKRVQVLQPQKTKTKHTQHKYSTANFKISGRKLNKLGRQIAGKPIDWAIMQMMFSEKRASKRIQSMLVVAKKHATKYKSLQEDKLLVAESWVTKGPRSRKVIDIKGRGRYGIRVHPDSRLHVVLKEGQTSAQQAHKERARQLKRIKSAGLVREDVPLRNSAPMWAW